MRSVLFSALPLCAVLSACISTHGAEGAPGANGSSDTAHVPDLVPVLPIDQGSACNPDVLPPYVGKTVTPALLEEIKSRSGAQFMRVGKPGMAMTMDFRADRITLFVDSDNRIETINCG